MINRVADGQYIIPNLMASFLENWSRDPIPVVTLNSLEYFDSAFGFYLWIKIMGIQSEWMRTCESSIFTAVFDPGVFEHFAFAWFQENMYQQIESSISCCSGMMI